VSPIRRVRRLLVSPDAKPRSEIAFVAFLSDEAHNYARALQLSLAREFGLDLELSATPHVTLKLSFQTPDLEPFVSYFDRLLTEVEPFQIRLRGFDAFPEGVVFMDVESNARLDALRRRVVADLAERHGVPPFPVEGNAFRLHVTLASGVPRRKLDRIREHLAATPADFRFELRALGLLCYTGGGWITYRRGMLSRTPGESGR